MYRMVSHSAAGGLVLVMLLCSLGVQETVSQIAPRLTCPDGWMSYMTQNNGLTCTWLSADKASWIDAMGWCKVLGGQLVEIGTQNFKHHVSTAIGSNINKGKYWIGSTKVVGFQFKWMTSGAPTNFRFFPSQQSSNGKNCVTTDEKGIWSAEDCKAEFWFIYQQIISQ